MTIAFWLLTMLYAVLMGGAAIAQAYQAGLPRWLLVLNVGFSLILLTSWWWVPAFYIGLLGLLGTALANGLVLNGRIRWSHFTVRAVLTAALIWWHLFL